MIYLASPYSDPDPRVVKQRFTQVERCTANLMQQGVAVFSPIVHCHALARRYDLPTDAAYWTAYNTDFMIAAEAIFVLCIPGWKASIGVSQEIEWCLDNGKSITFVSVKGIPVDEKV